MNKKKVLFVSRVLPLPQDAGGKIRSFVFLNGLHNIYDIYSLFVIADNEPQKNITETENFLNQKNIEYSIIKISDKNNFSANNFFTPVSIKKNIDSSLIKHFIAVQKNKNFEMVFFDTPWLMYLIDYADRSKIKVINLYNVEWLLLFRAAFADFSLNKLKIFLARLIQAMKLFFYERSALKKFDQIIVCSDNDKIIYQKYFSNELPLKTIPNMLDISAFEYKFKKQSTANLLFIGLLTYTPNINALKYFIEKIFPRILKRKEDARITIIGQANDNFSKYLKSQKNIQYMNYVKDCADYFYEADVFIAPFLFGSGTRLKIIEAFARGVPVVSTTMGAEGINCEHGKHIMLADSADNFATACLELLANIKLRETIAVGARLIAEEKYDINKHPNHFNFL